MDMQRERDEMVDLSAKDLNIKMIYSGHCKKRVILRVEMKRVFYYFNGERFNWTGIC